MIDLVHTSFVPDAVPFDEALNRCTHLAIGAHQDDLEIFAYHGIALCYDSVDYWFGGVTVTDGACSARAGAYADYSDEQMKEVRHREQIQAACIGKYSFQTQLGLASESLKNTHGAGVCVDALTEILKLCRPEVLYLHNPFDKHLTHLAVFQCCLEALGRLEPEHRPRNTFGCEVWRGLDWVDDANKVVLPADLHPELARSLIEVFQSQIASGKDYVEATLGRRRANATYFDSHNVDAHSEVIFSVDLNPLVMQEQMDLFEFIDPFLNGFKERVKADLRMVRR